MTEAESERDTMWRGLGNEDEQHNYDSTRDEKQRVAVFKRAK